MRLPGPLARSIFAALVALAMAAAAGVAWAQSGTVGPGKTSSGSHGTFSRLPTANSGSADKQQCQTFLSQWPSLSSALQSNPALIDRRNKCNALVNAR
jgi:hypothetical protein